jgi:cardiolipin synthase
VRFAGPSARQLQAAFTEEWAEATLELLTGDPLFPPVAVATDGAHLAGVLHSIPASGSSPAERLLALSIAGSRRTVYIANAYFLPNAGFRRLLTDATRRGVDVRILTNGENTDIPATRHASRAHYEELLAAGVRIFEYQPAMMHAKTFVVDGLWSSVGTMNFDNRSLALNNESTLVVHDQALGAAMDSLFLEDLHFAREITLDTFRRRPWRERLLERGASLLSRAL